MLKNDLPTELRKGEVMPKISLDNSQPQKSYSSRRSFQVWNFTVSHRQLLLRSVKSSENNTRIDILFKDVSAISMETSFDEILIEEVSQAVLGGAFLIGEVSKDHKVFRITTKTASGYLSALAYAVAEDEGEYHDPSAFMRSFSQ